MQRNPSEANASRKHKQIRTFPWVVLFLVSAVAVYTVYEINRARIRRVLIEKESGKLQLLAHELNHFYAPLVKNIEFLAKHDGVRQALVEPRFLPVLGKDWKMIGSAIQGYDQIRLLDLSGQEILRINVHGDRAELTDADTLQDKSGREYFGDARKLGPSDIYISSIDINQEFGRVEFPLKQVIRCAMQVYDDDDQPLGIVITNYIGEGFLPSLNGPADEPHNLLVGHNGVFIQSPDRYPRFSNLLLTEPPNRFDHFFPGVWDAIRDPNTPWPLINDQGIFFRETIQPPNRPVDAKQAMHLVAYIPQVHLSAIDRSQLLTNLIAPLIGVWTILGLLGFVTIKLDEQRRITERQTLLSERLSDQADELRRSNEELERFAFVASHDMQEPLRTISTCGKLLRSDHCESMDTEATGYIDIMVDASERMREMIQGLLRYSRVDTPRTTQESTNSAEAYQEAIEILSTVIDDTNAVVTAETELPVVTIAKPQLVQLLQNLIGNAIKYCEQQPKIAVSARRDSGDWHFCIEDNGIGIEPQYADRIFNLFTRLHNRSDYRGTGIGLAICKRIVECNHGRIWVETSQSGGSEFHFTLPAVSDAVTSTNQHSTVDA